MDDEIELEIESSVPEFGVGPVNEDQDMEEGELSDNEQDLRRTFNFGGRKKRIQDRLGPRVNFNENIDMSNKRLPDLVQQLGASSVTQDPDFAQKREARIKRFQLSNNLPEPSFNDVQVMYESLSVAKEELDIDPDERTHRFETIHVTGFSNKIVSDDLQEYFKDFNPIQCEWCDGKSANIIWGIDASAAKAMCNLSRPILQESDAMNTLEESGAEKRLLEIFANSGFNDPIDIKALGLPDPPPGGPWRIGKPASGERWSDTKAIFMRLSHKTDKKPVLLEKDLSQKNYMLKRDGGILSSSKKQKLREAMAWDQKQHEEHERSKKYQPGATWADLAEEWAKPKQKENDYSDDLRMLADALRNRGKRVASMPSAPRRQKDWDAPEEDPLEPLEYQPPSRKRRLIARDEDDSPSAETVKFADHQDEWTIKSKVPKMQMYADKVETKESARLRVHRSIKRRVTNNPTTELYEVEVSEDEDQHEDMRHKLNFKVKRGGHGFPEADARSRLNERFKLSSGLKARLGDKQMEAEEDSGDSLERDTGADLGEAGENMVIQVTHSDNEAKAMEEDNRDVDHRRKAPVADLRSKVSSQVFQIKTEKGLNKDEEHRKEMQRRRREHEEREAEVAREARRRQRSQRRLDADDQEERRRRREHERRYDDSRVKRNDHRDHHHERRDRRDEVRPQSSRDEGRNRDDRRERDRKEQSRTKSRPLKIKKEKVTDDESSSDDSSSSSSSSDSSSSSSSSDSSSSDSSSDSDSSDSSSASDRRKKSSRSSKTKDRKGSDRRGSDKRGGGQDVRDKLQEYLAKAKERRRKGGK